MTARPRAVAAAALVLASGLGAAPAAAAPAIVAAAASRPTVGSVTDRGAVVRSAPVGLLRSDPENGAWARRTPEAARLWFTSAAAARAAAVQVSTPRRTAVAGVRVTVSGKVLSVRLPDDGPGDYRVVWYVLPAAGKDPGYAADGAGGAAGTVAFRVGGVAPTAGPGAPATAATAAGPRRTSGTGSFTIPDRPATPPQDDGTGPAAPTSGAATATDATTPSAAATATPLPAGPTVPGSGTGSGTTSAPARLLPDAVGLAATALAGLIACLLAAQWSWRRATAAGLRPR